MYIKYLGGRAEGFLQRPLNILGIYLWAMKYDGLWKFMIGYKILRTPFVIWILR